MAASGVINGTTSNQYIAVKIEWTTFWQDTATNVSAVEAILYARRTNTGYVTSGTGSFTVSINGTASTTSKYVEIGESWVQIGSNAQQIAHEADGTKQINISASGSIPAAGLTSISCSGTATLDTIPRASTPTLSSSTFDMGTAVTISTNRASSSFLHHIAVIWDGVRTVIANDVADSYVWTPALSMASAIPNATSGTGQIELGTWSGETLIGVKTINFTARVPASVVPTAGALTVSDASGHTSKVGGVYVQNQSRASVSVGQSSGIYGSTIKSTVIKVGAVSRTATASTFDLPTAGTVSISATVTDSRGRTHTRTSTITVAAYTPPRITGFTAARVTAAGAADELGSYIRAISSGTATTLTNNTLSWAVAWLNGSTWTTLRSGTDTAAPLAWSDNAVVGAGGFSPTSSYRLRVTATDLITTTTREITLPTGSVTMSWGKTGVGIGKVVEAGRTLDVAGPIYETGQTLERLYGAGWVCYNHSGYLIQTNVTPVDNYFFMLDIRLNTNALASSVGTGEILVQGYAYGSGSAIIRTAAVSMVGVRDVYAFFLNGLLHFWLPGSAAETAHIVMRDVNGVGSANRRITAITDSAMPSGGSRSVAATVRTI